jgi:hypothetical protein
MRSISLRLLSGIGALSLFAWQETTFGLGGLGDPCQPGFEAMCDDPDGDGEPGGILPSIMCLCDGAWVEEEITNTGAANPPSPVTDQDCYENSLGYDYVCWTVVKSANYTTGSCHAEVTGDIQSVGGFESAGSKSGSASARYNYAVRVKWVPTGENTVPCVREVNLAATGSAGLSITVSCAAAAGCTGAASASCSASCSSLGNASADLPNQTITGSVGYVAASSSFSASGNISAQVTPYESASVEGSYSRSQGWQTVGSGSIAGSATFNVKPDRTYCAYTNKGYTKRQSGSVIANGSGTAAYSGSVSWTSTADAAFIISG